MMWRMTVVVAALSLAFGACGAGVQEEMSARTEARTWTAPDGGVFRYRWHAPKAAEAGKTYPLVVLMHGAGERGTNNVAQLQWGAKPIFDYLDGKKQEFFFVAGQVPNSKRWVEVDWNLTAHTMPEKPSETMALEMAFLEQLFASTPAIDRTRVYVTGVSMGGYGTWDLLCRRPEWFAAAMPICGGADVKQAPRLKDIPIWMHHGDRDTVVPFVRSRLMTAALWACGGNVKYTEHPGCGHASWIPAYGTKSNLDWFFAQKKIAPAHAEAAPFVVAKRGAAADVSVVVSAKALPCERYAAEELTNFVFRMTGVRLPVVSDAAALPSKAIVLGATRHTPPAALPQKEPSGDAFRLSVKDGRLYIGGAKRGVLYGVYELLERFGGCRWYASWCEKIPRCDSFEIPDGFVDEQRPAFLMREPFWWDVNKNRDFAARIRVNGYNHTPNDVPAKLGGDDYRFGGGLSSCHTFNRLCDPEVYFDAHPEYFSMIKGKRQKSTTQLCLTNPDVLRIVTSNVLARIRSDPGAKFYGVSQNDWYNYCECPACKAIDDEEESHAGTMVRFVNAVAEGVEKEFPGAIVETLAYQYTRKPPKKTKLRHNVVPCLCTIECDFSRPLTESRYRENVDFLKDIVGWSAQTEQLYVWDYVTNFRRYTMPHANFDALQGNVKCFRDNGVKYLFEQGDSLGRHADFAELKAWLLAKWMWNPDLPAEPLLKDFFDGYYGAAAPFVRTYFDELRAVQRKWSDDPTHPLRIYELSDYAAITDAFLERSAALLAKAAEAVRGDSVRAHNVRMCAFSVDCMRLDRMRKLVSYDLWIADEPFDVAVWKRGRELAQRVVKTLDEVPHIRLAESVSNADMNDAWRAMATNPPPSYVTGARSGVVGASRFEGNNPACKKAIVPCAGTKDGKALAFFETPWDWCGRYYLYGCRLQSGVRYRLRVRAKVEKATEPVAFRAGVRINDLGDDKVDRLVREIPASETSPDWKWYDVGACIPGPDDFFFVGHAATATKTGRTDEQKILVDCLELSRVEGP